MVSGLSRKQTRAEIKICGLRRAEDIDYANRLLPDYAGFVFAESRRRVDPEKARALISGLDRRIRAVGVFVDETAENTALTAKKCALSAVQLHGGEDARYITKLRRLLPPLCEIWKAVRVKNADDIKSSMNLAADRLLLDAFSPFQNGGTGKNFEWSLVSESGIDRPFFIAGGVNAENINDALSMGRVLGQRFGIDASSGAETDGLKDFAKMRRLIGAVRKFSET